MTSRKTQQEIDRTFKKVGEGIQSFEGIYEKIKTTSNIAQRDKFEDNLKREIKKLQRFRDQIKTWAAGNEVKDKGPLLEQRRAIETCMEQFKAVEKEMKTKAYSKEGLSAAARLDPKEKERVETCEFLSAMVDILQQKIEAMEAEEEMIQASMKKGKKDVTKTTRLSDISRISERHKWHVAKLELLLRSLQNGNVETSQVLDVKEAIKYYAEDGHNSDFCGEDETIYDDIELGDDEAQFGMGLDNDRVSSQDTQSIQEDEPPEARRSKQDPGPPRRSSTQMKSPLSALATLNLNGQSSTPAPTMKPAPPPTRLPGETLKYASAAAAAAASDKNGVGIAPLPPPPGASPAVSNAQPVSKPPSTASPQVAPVQPVQRLISNAANTDDLSSQSKSPTLSSVAASRPGTVPPTPAIAKAETASQKQPQPQPPAQQQQPQVQRPQQQQPKDQPITNGETKEEPSSEESVYHLPPGLQDLIHSFEVTKSRAAAPQSGSTQRLLMCCLSSTIHGSMRTERIETDTLFYLFYYRQATYQQFLAAKALKNQSWRFHKQYQTWFQRHEEPKTITEEFEQGTYRFFDYESTWMNRRKADFKFVYKFLEDDL
ncbi:conserved hypothetical protein [Uncinocarpus reesii 1704]|uniref:General negative regulator of transcription subunit n=1 Tax=Uncinocarpus reesii (strain UAMH 1704) TaxID=336963 RepID=C4JWY5_UNCRE|nr:uncharacterized protein UREG_06158 [Uncinocarpus reesii 1704]EEP81293.1 conserved hypothetical protein [Uncinocarpus reesii 1704]